MVASDSSALITLRALVAARWGLVGLLFAMGLVDRMLSELADPFLGWFPVQANIRTYGLVLGLWTAANIITWRVFVARGRASVTIAGVHLLVDVTAITLLLALAGGATNPFTAIYFVPITLATQVSPRWTWTLAGYSLAGFATLFLLHPVPSGPAGHGDHFGGHLRGMWLAFALAGALITYFVHRIALALARQRSELERLRSRAIEDRHLAALGTLAAGAAHELNTPMGTIQLLVTELPHMSAGERADAVASIRRELQRCKTIVQRMATPELRAYALAADDARSWPLAHLCEELEVPPGTPALRVDIRDPARRATTTAPHAVLAQIVRELIANAHEACSRQPDATGVQVILDIVADTIHITIADDGVGMSEELAAAAFDPFFSTKTAGTDAGENLGLGLYLVRAQLRQLGGDIELASHPGQGTRVTVRVPLEPVLNDA